MIKIHIHPFPIIFLQIVYDVKVLPDKVDAAVEAIVSAIASPPHASYVLEEVRPKAQLDYNKFAVDTSAQVQEVRKTSIIFSCYFPIIVRFLLITFSPRCSCLAPIGGCLRRESSRRLQTGHQPQEAQGRRRHRLPQRPLCPRKRRRCRQRHRSGAAGVCPEQVRRCHP